MPAFIIFTAQQVADVADLDNIETDASIRPRGIDGALPGQGLNINPDAVGYAIGEGVSLAGKAVIGPALFQDDQYSTDQKEFCQALPIANLDTDMIFAPQEA